ncbi:MAG: DNA-binding protein [Clostridia bacterium]|nr:DNA-binding protein [Clostridia bacterium]
MVLDENVRLCLLNDFYGALLTQNQQNVLDSYLNFNMPLSEISQSLGITRQAVLDTIKKASKKLDEFENKLGMLKKYLSQQKLAVDCGKTNDDFVKKIMEIWRQD